MSVAFPVYVRDDINTAMRQATEASGISINQFINDAIEARLEAIKAEEWRKALEDACANDPEPDLSWIESSMSQVEHMLVEHEK